MNLPVRGGYHYAGNRYELHQATMADLIRTAWSVEDNNRVLDGPGWLDDIRFDVLAKAPESTDAHTAKIMLRRLLADRKEVGVHEDAWKRQCFALRSRGKAGRPSTAAAGRTAAGDRRRSDQ
jgi:uncharacterized protein (TIGR03435 family)